MDNFLYNILRGLVNYRIGIFFILAFGLILFLTKFLRGLREWQRSVFGLERSMAQRKLVGSVAGLTLLVLLFIGEFLLATVVGPQMPSASVEETASVESPLSVTETLSVEEDTVSPTPGGQQSARNHWFQSVLKVSRKLLHHKMVQPLVGLLNLLVRSMLRILVHINMSLQTQAR